MAELSPIDWAKRPIQKYAVFSGRAPRAEYWWYTLAVIVAYILVMVIESIIGMEGMFGPYGPLTLLLVVALILPGLGVTVRRLHDTNRSGWWILVAVVPYVVIGFTMGRAAAEGDMASLGAAGIFGILAMIGAIVLLVFMLLPGTKGDNRFGPDPYAGDPARAAA